MGRTERRFSQPAGKFLVENALREMMRYERAAQSDQHVKKRRSAIAGSCVRTTRESASTRVARRSLSFRMASRCSVRPASASRRGSRRAQPVPAGVWLEAAHRAIWRSRSIARALQAADSQIDRLPSPMRVLGDNADEIALDLSKNGFASRANLSALEATHRHVNWHPDRHKRVFDQPAGRRGKSYAHERDETAALAGVSIWPTSQIRDRYDVLYQNGSCGAGGSRFRNTLRLDLCGFAQIHGIRRRCVCALSRIGSGSSDDTRRQLDLAHSDALEPPLQLRQHVPSAVPAANRLIACTVRVWPMRSTRPMRCSSRIGFQGSSRLMTSRQVP